MKRKKIILISIAAVAGIALVVLLIVTQLLTGRKISYNEDFSASVRAELIIERDGSGIPRISAANYPDAMYALGYCHCIDRFPLMEYDRAVASAKADRVMSGDQGRLLSRLAVMLAIQEKARSVVSSLDAEHRGLLDAYVLGINDARTRNSLSLYSGSGYSDEPWTAEDIIAIDIFRSWTDSFLSSQELLFAISEKKYFPGLEDFFQSGVVSTYREKYSPYADLLFSLKKALKGYYGEQERLVSLYVPSKDGDDDFFAVSAGKNCSVSPSVSAVILLIGGKRYDCLTRAGSPFPVAVISDSLRYSTSFAGVDVTDFYLLPVEEKDGVSRYFSELSWKEFSGSRKTAS
ncbi:MAG: penicillin acylase family protein, partial [Spirochaetota bacterium]